MFKAVLFDLDGTLLRLDTGEFMKEYLKELSQAVISVLDPSLFVKALLASTEAMKVNRNPNITNAQVFWEDFSIRLKDDIKTLQPLMDEFYRTRFKNLARIISPSSQARFTVEAALDQGLRIALATNPVFPMTAVRQRMVWAGVENLPWEMVTSYEEMHFCKPHPEYYREIASMMDLPAETCLMVGNDTEEDLAAFQAGMKTYLVTDCLYNPSGKAFYPDWEGSLEELARWFEASSWKQCDLSHC